VQAASARGLNVAFDGNFRSKLWQAWQGDPGAILHEIFACATLVFADQRDIGMVLGRDFSAAASAASDAAAAAFAAFPRLARIAMTQRRQHSVDHHELSARLFTREAMIETDGYTLNPIVDRIGAGDAFAAGMLHALCSGMSDADALGFALAAACLKHSVPGDALCLKAEQVGAFLRETPFDVRR
jgi:2-dehydro-3-deoxygluconokinase